VTQLQTPTSAQLKLRGALQKQLAGGKVEAGYALLGETDVVVIVDFPGVKEAMKASVELTKLLGISFTTAPAVTMEEFDELIEGG